jgi:hypothetical protein
MKLKFVDDETINNLAQGRKNNRFADTIEELYKHPNRWIEYNEKIASAGSTCAQIRKRFKDIETKVTGGNNLTATHPDKKLWTLYLRYVPTTTEEETF